MKAIQLEQYGDPTQVLSLQECTVPEPMKGEVRIRVFASPVNPADLLFIRGQYAGVQPHFPSAVGFEGVGIVDRLGPDVTGLVPGQRVAAINTRKGGNWAEFAILPDSNVIPVPDDLPDEQVASFVVNPSSAIMMVRRVLAVPRGEWLLQSAASSELGRMIIRLAKHDGIRTLNVVRRREAVAELEQLGADAVIVSTEGPIDEQVRRIVGAEGVKYAIDPVVGETGTQIYQSLCNEGRMLVYGSLTGEPMHVGVDPRQILAGRRILEVFWGGYWWPRLDRAEKRSLVDEIIALMREGVLVTSGALKFPLHQIHAAVKQAETKGRQGKVLLIPGA